MGADKREALTMQEGGVEPITFRREKGCFLSTTVIIILLILFIGSLVAVGLIVHYMAGGSVTGEDGSVATAGVGGGGGGGGEGTEYYVVTQESPTDGSGKKKKEYPYVRLPRSLVPTHYKVRLVPFINGNFSIHGYVEATFKVVQDTSNVTLHINGIVTQNNTIMLRSSSTGKSVPIRKHSFDTVREFYIAHLDTKLMMGEEYTLSMHYEGYLNDDLDGFYRSSYKNEKGETKWLATTQFQPTDARKAFPCFDEPHLKANFTIEMAHQDNMTAISNMPKRHSTPFEGQPGWQVTYFETSVPMSTYLVAFVVSDFTYLESPNSPNYKFRVWARKGAIAEAQYALKVGPPISQYFEEFFKVPFPLPKQDMIALPDFGAGAMENWGLITYRESVMLHNPKTSRASDKEFVGIVVSHELAHQWFGNLVTPSWWTDLWLNEGFASYVEYLGYDAVEPTFKMMEQFVVSDLQRVFGLDCLESSHPINIPVQHPDEINEIFDAISYSKGASIIRMISHFLSEETFRNGLSNYLEGLKYLAVAQDDLWRYLTEQAHLDGTLSTDVTVKTIMDTWTLQMGFPVITVEAKGDGTAMLTQERFLLVRSGNSTDKHDYKWWVPITFTTASSPNFENTRPTEWMTPQEATKTISGLPKNSNDWVIFNVQETGYYRVNYDARNWEAITTQLLADHTVITTTNRAQLIDDALTLSRAGLLPYETSLKVLSYLKNENEYVPWKAALNGLDYVQRMLEFTGGYGAFQDYMLSITVPMYNKLGFADSLQDPHLDQKKRASILWNTCSLGYKPCLNESVTLYRIWMDNPNNTEIVSPNLKSTVYCNGVREGGLTEWRFAWDQYEASNSASEKRLLLRAMGCTNQLWILSGYLKRAMEKDGGIRKQDASTVVNGIAGNAIGRAPAWEFIRDQWKDILKYYGATSFTLNSLIKSTTRNLNSKNKLNELKAFKSAYEGHLASARRAVDQAVENAGNNVAWMDKNYHKIMDWLKKNGFDNTI